MTPLELTTIESLSVVLKYYPDFTYLKSAAIGKILFLTNCMLNLPQGSLIDLHPTSYLQQQKTSDVHPLQCHTVNFTFVHGLVTNTPSGHATQ